MSNENDFDRITILGLDLEDVIHLIRQYQLRGVDVYELAQLRWEVRKEKLKMEELKNGIKDLLEKL